MHRLLVDECTGLRLFNLLKKSYDCVFVSEIMRGASDFEVLEYAEREGRILITDDKDFGELVFRLARPHKGVILLRTNSTDPVKRFSALKKILDRFESLDNKFIVLSEKSARVRTIK